MQRVMALRNSPEWSSVKSLLARIQYAPSTLSPLLPAELSEAEIVEYDLLLLAEDAWQRLAITLDEKGNPLTSQDEQGRLVIHDPVLAEWDARARANAEKMEAELAKAVEVARE